MSVAEQTRPNVNFHLRLRATTAAASTLRARIRNWLTEIGASPEEILDLQLACSELLTIMIGDAAALVVDVEGWSQPGLRCISLREYGLCRTVTRIELDQEGMFSIALIQALIDDLDIRWQRDGRTAILSRRLRHSTRNDALTAEKRGGT